MRARTRSPHPIHKSSLARVYVYTLRTAMIYRIVAIISTTPGYENRNSAAIDPISPSIWPSIDRANDPNARGNFTDARYPSRYPYITGIGRGGKIARIITRQFLIAFKVFSRIASNLGGLIGKIETNRERGKEEKRKKGKKGKRKVGEL